MDFNGGNRRVFNRLGGPSTAPTDSSKNQKVCYHWQAGRCNRNPCHFLHRELPLPSAATANGSGAPKRFADDSGFSGPAARRGPNYNNNYNNTWGRMGANKVFVSGISLPGLDKLYTGSKDGTVRAWDTGSGQKMLLRGLLEKKCALMDCLLEDNFKDDVYVSMCMGVINLGGEVGCMISEGPWLFVGIPNFVKAWNTQTNAELSLSGPVGQVYAMVVGNDLLFAGSQDGTILAWKFNAVTNNFEPAASLKGHTLAVVSLVVGANRLYSGSVDHSIKVWVATENGNLEVTYTHNEEHGLLILRGMHDMESKPVLLCVCNDNSVRLYDLPSFSERGKIFAKQEIRAIEVGPSGLFFTGDGTGFKVWKWAEAKAIATS
ncbi:hypothetical protein COLO4_14246 [Corchorus olitorius]|uniref:C3H1-type domain-containing protein n=1 Tax=Corchorus olitorius TaxID=93759 RepID=A0A1R3JSV3_9ROSI|nr:hypothetical protein COLO4_14246 [Corchorus olitorius]